MGARARPGQLVRAANGLGDARGAGCQDKLRGRGEGDFVAGGDEEGMLAGGGVDGHGQGLAGAVPDWLGAAVDEGRPGQAGHVQPRLGHAHGADAQLDADLRGRAAVPGVEAPVPVHERHVRLELGALPAQLVKERVRKGRLPCAQVARHVVHGRGLGDGPGPQGRPLRARGRGGPRQDGQRARARARCCRVVDVKAGNVFDGLHVRVSQVCVFSQVSLVVGGLCVD